MIIRYSKIILIFCLAFYVTLVALGNITDYQTNFQFVSHVLKMDSIFPNSNVTYRSINSPIFHHLSYIFIILFEILTAIVLCISGFKMFKSRKNSSIKFKNAKKLSVVGLIMGFIIWHTGFVTIGGEWFSMWQSKIWNGEEAAFHIFTTFLLVLIYITMDNDLLETKIKR